MTFFCLFLSWNKYEENKAYIWKYSYSTNPNQGHLKFEKTMK